jgi:hypothetical protein
VEHVVQFGAGRQIETNGHLVDELGDAIWPKETGLKLALR